MLSNDSMAKDDNIQNISLKVEPVVDRLFLREKDVVKHNITITNPGPNNLHVKVYPSKYNNLDGSTENTLDDAYNQIYRWIKFENKDGKLAEEVNEEIEPSSSRTITYTVTAPESVPDGGQYAFILVDSVPQTDDSNITIKTKSRTVIKLLAEAEGETNYQASIDSLGCNGLRLVGDIALNAEIVNSGNIDIQANTEMNVQSLFGKELYHDVSADTILPGKSLNYILTWEDTPAIGIFRVAGTVTAAGKTENISQTVFILPIWFILVLIADSIGVYFLQKRIRERNRKINPELFAK